MASLFLHWSAQAAGSIPAISAINAVVWQGIYLQIQLPRIV
jgi:hypothetical protein